MSAKQHERSTTGFGSECKWKDIWAADADPVSHSVSLMFRRYSQYRRGSGHLWLDPCCTVLCYMCTNVSLIALRDSESKLIDWFNPCLSRLFQFWFVVLFPVGRPRIRTSGDHAFRSHSLWWCQRTGSLLCLTLCRFDHQSRSPNE